MDDLPGLLVNELTTVADLETEMTRLARLARRQPSGWPKHVAYHNRLNQLLNYWQSLAKV